MAIAWNERKREELLTEAIFPIDQCMFSMYLPRVEINRDTYFHRSITHPVESRREETQTFTYFDLAVVTFEIRTFQHMRCSMKFDHSSYSLFSGQSKKVFIDIDNFIFTKIILILLI